MFLDPWQRYFPDHVTGRRKPFLRVCSDAQGGNSVAKAIFKKRSLPRPRRQSGHITLRGTKRKYY
jgi:hypothetical protein